MKIEKVKARKYWRGRNTCVLYPKKESAVYYAGFSPYAVNSVFLLPADAESVERMVGQIEKEWEDMAEHFTAEKIAHAALAAIGIKAKGKK